MDSEFLAAKSKAGSARTAKQALPRAVGRLPWQVLTLLYQLQLRQGGHDGLHNSEVFRRLDTAGAVHYATTGTQPLNGLEEQSCLQDDQFLLALFAEAPASFGAPSQHSCVGAGGIDEDGIKGSRRQVTAVALDQPCVDGLKFESSRVVTHSIQASI